MPLSPDTDFSSFVCGYFNVRNKIPVRFGVCAAHLFKYWLHKIYLQKIYSHISHSVRLPNTYQTDVIGAISKNWKVCIMKNVLFCSTRYERSAVIHMVLKSLLTKYDSKSIAWYPVDKNSKMKKNIFSLFSASSIISSRRTVYGHNYTM